MRFLRHPYDLVVRLLAVGVVVVLLIATGYHVGRARGVHEERLKAWRECARRNDEWARSARMQLVRLADPCADGGR